MAALGGVTETLPAGFAYVSSSDRGVLDAPPRSRARGGQVHPARADKSFSYVVTASSVEGDHAFEGTLTDEDRGSSDVGGASVVTVDATPGPEAVDVGDLQFDVVKTKAVKGAVVSGLKESDRDSKPPGVGCCRQ